MSRRSRGSRPVDRGIEPPLDGDDDAAIEAFAAWAAVHIEGHRRPRTRQSAPVRGPAVAGPISGAPDNLDALTPPRRRISTPRIRATDRAVFHQLACTGVAAERQLIEGAGLSAHRLERLIAAGFLRVDDRIVGEHLVRIYTLGPAGISRLRREGFGRRYKRNPHQLGHDLKLTEMYYALPPDVRVTWRHEGELTEAMKADGTYAGTCVDAAVEVDGQWVAIEALTAHYRPQQIAAKQAVIDQHFGGRGIML